MTVHALSHSAGQPRSILLFAAVALALVVAIAVYVSTSRTAEAATFVLVPTEDLSNNGGWTNELGDLCGPPILTCAPSIDEDVDTPDDSDAILSGYGVDNADVVFGLTPAPADLAFITDLTVRFRAFKEGGGGATALVVTLEADFGVVGTPVFAALTNSPTEFTYSVSGLHLLPADVDGLYAWVRGDVTNPAPDTRVIVSGINLEATYTPVGQNPRLEQSCGADIALVIDTSSSVDPTELAQQQAAFKGFVDAFLPATPSHMAVVQFNRTATLLSNFSDDPVALKAAIDATTTSTLTNWDDGLNMARNLFPHRSNPDLIVFASDGFPNTIGGHDGEPVQEFLGEGPALVQAILEANAAKGAGIHIFALGIGDDFLSSSNLELIASPASTVVTDFGELAADLSKLADSLCGGTVTVHKVIDQDGDLQTTFDQGPGIGWTFTAGTEQPDESATPPSGDTDHDGLINFDIELGADQTALVAITETLKPDFTFIAAFCRKHGEDTGTPDGLSVTNIPVGPNDIITCWFFNKPPRVGEETETPAPDTPTPTPTQTPDGKLRVKKFYDKNANGINDDGIYLEDWLVTINPGNLQQFTPVSLYLAPGNYTVAEGQPLGDNWVGTTPGSVNVTLDPGERESVYFGNVCLGDGGGKTKGFWSNKNGKEKVFDYGTATPELTMLSNLNLRTSSGGHFNPTSYPQLQSWLLNATSTNMAYMLSAQLAAMALNVEAGFVDGNSLVHAPGLLPYSVPGLNASGFITVSDLMTAANAELGLHGSTPAGNVFRAYQEALKDALDDANNDETFVQRRPCKFSFPCPEEEQVYRTYSYSYGYDDCHVRDCYESHDYYWSWSWYKYSSGWYAAKYQYGYGGCD